MRLWWVSMSLFMELEGELGVAISSCCSSNGIPHWLMRLERSEELVVVSSSFTSSIQLLEEVEEVKEEETPTNSSLLSNLIN